MGAKDMSGMKARGGIFDIPEEKRKHRNSPVKRGSFTFNASDIKALVKAIEGRTDVPVKLTCWEEQSKKKTWYLSSVLEVDEWAMNNVQNRERPRREEPRREEPRREYTQVDLEDEIPF
jgi:hypothetical protein